ncbi:MAG TPA: hypothetical protein VKM72_10810 [Thermoanaerobaculia bacterium]|nr:hypothetical protein [Thermoanaerobaculia bacterium]
MPQTVRSCAAIVFLFLVLVALPAVAGEQGTRPPKEQGLLVSLWQAVMDLNPGLAQLGPGLDSLGGDDPEPAPQGDLGPGLDPAG